VKHGQNVKFWCCLWCLDACPCLSVWH